jgi:hypothetical protein
VTPGKAGRYNQDGMWLLFFYVAVVLMIVYCHKILSSNVRLSQYHLTNSITDTADTADTADTICIPQLFNLASQ